MRFRHPRTPSDRFDIEFDRAKPFDLVGFGQNAVDHMCVVPHYPEFDTKTEILRYELLPGGMVATAVVCASRMGLKTKYIGKVGSDFLGRVQLDSLRSESVDTSSVIVENGARNQYAFIVIDQSSGERTILWQRDDRLDFREGELRREDVCCGRILHLDAGNYKAALEAVAWAHQEGMLVAIDVDHVYPHSREIIYEVDFLICSENFPRELAGIGDLGEGLRAMRRFCPGFLAVTLGARGVMALFGDECVRFPAFQVHAVDTTGAGDNFRGAFIYGVLQNWPVGDILRFANAAAGLSCTQIGARAGIPTLEEALRLAGHENLRIHGDGQ
jgi:sulfofructose kinase